MLKCSWQANEARLRFAPVLQARMPCMDERDRLNSLTKEISAISHHYCVVIFIASAGEDHTTLPKKDPPSVSPGAALMKRAVCVMLFYVLADAMNVQCAAPNYPLMVLPGAHPDSFPDTETCPLYNSSLWRIFVNHRESTFDGPHVA
jgi:hypothetical protein